MRVEGPKGSSGVGSKKRAGQQGSGFTLPGAEGAASTSSSAGVAGGTSVQSLDAILALQSVEDDGDRSRRAVQHGHDLLDQLEALRADLLAGHVEPQRVGSLLSLIRAKQEVDDPQLKNLVDDIALRARVELAKLGVDP